MVPPNHCTLTYPSQCQSNSNPPLHCPSSKFYQPPLPGNITLNGKYYTQLESDDIDCGDDDWSKGCTKEFCDRQTDGIKAASTVMSIPYIISACLSPLLGGFVDKFGMRAVISTIAPVALIVVHLLMASTDVNPIGPMVGQGLAYSAFAAVIWPSVPLVVEKKLIGLGYGTITSVQNAGLAAFPLIVAAIYQQAGDEYIPKVEYFFVALACLGAAVGVYLNIYDWNNNHIFNSPSAKVDETYEVLLMGDGDQDHPQPSPHNRKSGSFSAHEEVFRARIKSK